MSTCSFQLVHVFRALVYYSVFSSVFVSCIFVSFSGRLSCYEEESVIGRARRPRWLMGQGSRGLLEFLERIDEGCISLNMVKCCRQVLP